jgi:hydroxymethylglutaryl-CoA reductase
MKMHLMNILNQMGATADEKIQIASFFNGKTVVHSDVVEKFNELRAL